nr:hypothetical protein I308_06547 [Cryptococcus tetragattii IND107]
MRNIQERRRDGQGPSKREKRTGNKLPIARECTMARAGSVSWALSCWTRDARHTPLYTAAGVVSVYLRRGAGAGLTLHRARDTQGAGPSLQSGRSRRGCCGLSFGGGVATWAAPAEGPSPGGRVGARAWWRARCRTAGRATPSAPRGCRWRPVRLRCLDGRDRPTWRAVRVGSAECRVREWGRRKGRDY